MDVESSTEKPGRLELEVTQGGGPSFVSAVGGLGGGCHRNESGRSSRTWA